MKEVESEHIELEEREVNIFQQITAKFLPYWPLLILFILLSLSAAYIYLRYATPMFEAHASIIIKEDRRGGNDAQTMEALNLITSQKNLENELKILQSRSLMEDVIVRLYLYAPISQHGKVKSIDAYLLSPIIVEIKNIDSLVPVEKVDFSYNNATQTVTLDEKDSYPINEFVTTRYGVLRFKPNKYYNKLHESDKKLSFGLIKPSTLATFLSLGLKIVAGASVDLSYEDPIPQRAINILNSLIYIYENESIEEKNNLTKNTLAFINEQLEILGQDLDSIETGIQKFRTGNNAIDIGAQGNMYLSKVADNDQRLGEINNQMAILGQVEKYVTDNASESGILPSTLGVGDPALSNLTEKLYTSELELSKLKKTMGANNPRVLTLESEIKTMKPAVLENIKSQKSNLAAARHGFSSANGGLNSMLQSIPLKERELLDISREKQTKNNLYQFLLQKKQESELSFASTTSNSKILDPAIASQDPVSPNKKLIYMAALVGAFGLFVGIIFAKDFLSNKVRYRDELQKMTSIPIIGEIAFNKSETPLVIEKGSRSFVAEEFRKLRISLAFLGIDSSHKKILFTSSISGEGKSFIATNLAVSISLTGKKVVLVDLDLNRPTLSKKLNVHFDEGVTDFLQNKRKADEIINKLEGHDNLYFIDTGKLPDNPTELLVGSNIESLISYLDANFDIIIIDTSPAELVTDAFILSALCDTTLYIVRHNYTPKMIIKRIDGNHQINPIVNPAIIFNGLKSRGVFKYNYGYGYNYVYDKSYYGDDKKSKKQKKSV